MGFILVKKNPAVNLKETETKQKWVIQLYLKQFISIAELHIKYNLNIFYKI